MIYAMPRTSNTTCELVVGANTNTEKFELWFERVTGGRITSMHDALIDPLISKFKHPVYIFSFEAESAMNSFVAEHNINSVSESQLVEHHEDMLSYDAPDPMLDNTTTISDAFELGKSDKWDERSEQEIADDANRKAKVDQMSKRVGGALSGSSFDPKMGGASDGTFDIGTITVSQGNNVSVKATKKAGVSSSQINTDDIFDIDVDDDSEPSEELIADMANAIFDQFGIEKCNAFLSSTITMTAGELQTSIRRAILNAQIAESLEPVNDTTEIDVAVDKVRARVEKIAGLSQTEVDAVMERAEEKMRAPRPQPSNFIFFENAKLTASDGMRGEGIPIIHIVAHESNDTFSVNDCILYFKEFGLTMVSSGLFSYEVKPSDPTFTDDIVGTLVSAGFILDSSALPQAIQPTMQSSNGSMDSNDIAKALAGNGTTTVEGTGSFGKNKVGKSEEDYANDIDLGVIGDKGAVIPQDANLTLTAWDNLPDYLQEAYEIFDTHPSNVMFGDYSGMTVGESLTVITMSDGETVWHEACANIRIIGGAKTDNSQAVIVQRDNESAVGIIAITSAENAVKVYRLK